MFLLWCSAVVETETTKMNYKQCKRALKISQKKTKYMKIDRREREETK